MKERDLLSRNCHIMRASYGKQYTQRGNMTAATATPHETYQTFSIVISCHFATSVHNPVDALLLKTVIQWSDVEATHAAPVIQSMYPSHNSACAFSFLLTLISTMGKRVRSSFHKGPHHQKSFCLPQVIFQMLHSSLWCVWIAPFSRDNNSRASCTNFVADTPAVLCWSLQVSSYPS